jgi:hypothetical protein
MEKISEGYYETGIKKNFDGVKWETHIVNVVKVNRSSIWLGWSDEPIRKYPLKQDENGDYWIYDRNYKCDFCLKNWILF